MRSHLPRLLRYFAVSVIATLTTMVVLGVLIATQATSPGLANVIATCAGGIPSFELNRAWVWNKRGPRSMGKEVGVFWAMAFISLLCSTIVVAIATHRAEAAGFSTFGRTVTAQFANLATNGTLWLGQYMIFNKFLFGAPPTVAVED